MMWHVLMMFSAVTWEVRAPPVLTWDELVTFYDVPLLIVLDEAELDKDDRSPAWLRSWMRCRNRSNSCSFIKDLCRSRLSRRVRGTSVGKHAVRLVRHTDSHMSPLMPLLLGNPMLQWQGPHHSGMKIWEKLQDSRGVAIYQYSVFTRTIYLQNFSPVDLFKY